MDVKPPPPPPPPAVQVQQVTGTPADTTTHKPESSPATPSATPIATPAANPNSVPAVAPDHCQDTPATSTEAEVIYVPSYSRWFSWNNIHECEVRYLPEFFDGKSPSKNPRVYKYYRNSIIRRSRENSPKKITFTDARKTIIGDVGSVRKVFDFLESWGLINYTPGAASKVPLKWEDKESKSSTNSSQSAAEPSGGSNDFTVPKKRLCSGCKSVCSIACFACEKYDLTLCARCYVRGNYRVGVSSTDFKRVEINEETKADWTDKETLHLLEAIMHFGDDWKKVAAHVGGRSERECVSRFLKLPFGEQFEGPSYSSEAVDKFNHAKDQNDTDSGLQNSGTSVPSKKMRLNPLADASNPIMTQAAFLSALAGVDVSEVAARAAVRALSELNSSTSKEDPVTISGHAKQQDADATPNGDTTSITPEEAGVDVQSELEEEQRDLERAVSRIIDVQMKEIQEKISHFEVFESQMEREWQQLQQMKNSLFVDQLTLLLPRSSAPKVGESMQQQNVKIE